MKYATTAIAFAFSNILTGCLNDEPRIIQVQVPVPVQVAPAPVAAPVPNIQVALPPQEEPRVVEVLSATPTYRETQVPKQQCHTENVPVEYEEQEPTTQEVPNDEPRRLSGGGAVLGGLGGALAGHQVGNGSGRQLATLIGLVGGAMAGSRMGSDIPPATRTITVMQTVTRTRYEQRERCETVNETSREVVNYSVTFNYKGQLHTTVLPYDPGSSIILGMAGVGGR